MKSESNICSFDSKRAYHAMQAAQQIMQESNEKMLAARRKSEQIYHEIGDLQNQCNRLQASKNEEWKVFSTEFNKIKALVGEKIDAVAACYEQEESFRALAKEEKSKERQSIYEETAKFFSKLSSQKMLERDDLIVKKRQMVRPDMTMLEEMRKRLENLREEQNDIVEAYHQAKSDFSLKKAAFDRAKSKYENTKNPEQKQDVDANSSRPKTMELDESLLKLAGVPEEDWESCTMERRADGKVDIYYGGGKNARHGHAIVAGNVIEYSRKPKKVPIVITKTP